MYLFMKLFYIFSERDKEMHMSVYICYEILTTRIKTTTTTTTAIKEKQNRQRQQDKEHKQTLTATTATLPLNNR